MSTKQLNDDTREMLAGGCGCVATPVKINQWDPGKEGKEVGLLCELEMFKGSYCYRC